MARLRAKLDELVRVKAALAVANAEIYEKIFRLAELKGLVATLTALDTKSGVFHEGGRFGDPGSARLAEAQEVSVRFRLQWPPYTVLALRK